MGIRQRILELHGSIRRFAADVGVHEDTALRIAHGEPVNWRTAAEVAARSRLDISEIAHRKRPPKRPLMSREPKTAHQKQPDPPARCLAHCRSREESVRYGINAPEHNYCVVCLVEAAGRPFSLQEVGEYFGVTKERARQIEDSAIRKLYRLKAKGAFDEILGP